MIVGVAAVLRFVKLGERPMHHDESLDAWFSWRISHGEAYSYDPAYHGPLRFYLTAGFFRLLGEGEVTARLLAASCGVGMVALAGALRRWLGDVGSLAAAALLAVSPSMLYFSRFGREDMPFALLELALLVVVASWLTRPARWHPPVAGALLAAAFATKETSFIVVAVLATYLGGLWLLEVLDRHRPATATAPPPPTSAEAQPVGVSPAAGAGRPPDEAAVELVASTRPVAVGVDVPDGVSSAEPGGVTEPGLGNVDERGGGEVAEVGSGVPVAGSVGEAVRAPGWRWLGLGAAAFVLVFSACFSVGFTNPGGVVDGAVDGIDYWMSQQPVNRGSQPWLFYVTLLAGYEWVVVPLAVVGAVVAVRRPDPVRGLILWTAVANLIIYSWASERFPWLVVHPLLPLVLLAGLGVERLWQLRPVVAGGVMGAAVAASLVVAWPAVYVGPSDPRQLLVAVQSSEQLLDVRDRVDEVLAATPDAKVVIDTSDSATWPWAWYLRDDSVLFADLAADPGAVADADVVLAMASNVAALPAPPGGWRAQPFAHRVWWLPPWDDSSPADWAGWITTRETFGPLGSLDAVELERPDLQPSP